MAEEMTQLFNVPETLSPRLAWLRKYQVHTRKTDGDEDGENPWVAWSGDKEPPAIVFACGETEDDAIADLAITFHWPLWNEEGFKG